MNHIYKVIFNKSLGAFVAVSELAKSHRKKSAKRSPSMGGISIQFEFTALMSTLLLMSGQVLAATGTQPTYTGTLTMPTGGTTTIPTTTPATTTGNLCYFDSGSKSVICGDSNTANSIIDRTTNKTTTGASAVVLGVSAKASGLNSVAIGSSAQALGNGGIAIGEAAKAQLLGSIAIGQGAQAIVSDTTAGGIKQTSAGIAIGRNSYAPLGNDVTIGVDSGSRVNQNTLSTSIEMFNTGNTVVGSQSGLNVYGYKNTAIGYGSGQNIGTATIANYANLSIGDSSGNNIRGNNNTNIGYQSGLRIISNSNTVIGTRSGRDINGADNVTIGVYSGQYVNGVTNWSNGFRAGNYIGVLSNAGSLDVNTGKFANNSTVRSSNQNIAAGASAGSYIGGNDNIALGSYAGQYVGHKGAQFGAVSTGNIAVGSNSGQYIEGNYNMAQGFEAGKGKTVDNTLIRNRSISQGYQATAYSDDSIAIGSNAIAGKQSSNGSESANAIAVGTGAKADAANSIAIGTGNIVSGVGSGAIGDPSYINGAGTYTLGNDNGTSASPITAGNSGVFGNGNMMAGSNTQDGSRIIGNNNNVTTDNTFVLGNNIGTNGVKNGGSVVPTVANSVYLGSNTTAVAATGKNVTSANIAGTTSTGGATGTVTNAIVNGITYGSFAGATSVGAVTVGASDAERRIQNVAAGEISATSTDAINGSQLYTVASQASKPLTITGNLNKDTDTDLLDKQYAAADGTQRQLGETLNIIGATNAVATSRSTDTAVTGEYSAKNIQTVISNGEVQIQMAQNPEFNTIKIGDSTNTTTLSSNADGLDIGGDKITNIAAGTADTDAVNVSQLQAAQAAATTEVTGSGLATVTLSTGTSGQTIYNVDVAKAVTPTFINGNVNVATADTNKVMTAGDVATAINNSGFTLTASGTNGSLVKPGSTINMQNTDGNIVISKEKSDNEVVYNLAKNISLDSVTTGNTLINTNGITVTNVDPTKTVSFTIAGLNNGGNKITNVAAGTSANDAVNYSQLKAVQAASTSKVVAGSGITVITATNTDGSSTYTVAAKADGETIKVDDADNIAAVTSDITTNGKGVSTATTSTALVTAGDVATAINNSGFTLSTSANGGEKLSGSDELITPGNTVNLVAGKNLTVKQESDGKVTFATADQVSFDQVTIYPG